MGRSVANHVTIDMTSSEILETFRLQISEWALIHGIC